MTEALDVRMKAGKACIQQPKAKSRGGIF